ncbi:hypothetical protein VTL71DRAFT_3289 [Oculimacula yallundae]|uniref:Pentatricopeptide repeat protein n=1 Tax=Oculimacula yallundae TaxID=86028 RepID=A0ABR4C6Q1_9HELO
MPTSLPVPSKGALRALRQLALGTSCTIAIGAGLLTEDRRRRIHSATEIHDNAKRLKSSRQYHSTGTTSLEALEGQISRYRDEAFWLPSNVSKSKAPAMHSSPTKLHPPTGQLPLEKEQSWSPLNTPEYAPRQPTMTKIPPLYNCTSSKYQTLNRAKHRLQQSANRQKRIASDIEQLLDEDSPNVERAASQFFEYLEEELPVSKSGLQPELIETAARLARACQGSEIFLTASSRILDIVLSYGPITESNFELFQPHKIMAQLISHESLSKDEGVTDYSAVDPEKLQKACSYYLTRFLETPKPTMSPEMRSMGQELCQATCSQKMFDLTLALFARLEKCRAGNQPTSVDCLIKARHYLGHHKKIFRHFQQLYTQTSPDQSQFFQVTSLAIDSALHLGNLDEAEQILTAAIKMAQVGGLELSTTWFLRIIGEEYRAHRDLARVQGLFKRLQPLSMDAHHPQAVYAAMIQYCVEARQEELAASYYSELRQWHERSFDDPADLRICGHFALAKAYRGDWDGVKRCFDELKQSAYSHGDVLSAVFTPVFKEFAKSNSVDDIEDFMQYFIVELGLKTTPLIMNAMIDIYSKVHEVDAIFRWISYATADGCVINSTVFNVILRNCANTFRFSYNEVYGLYLRGKNHSADLVNDDSLSILRGLAISRDTNEATRSKTLQSLKQFDELIQTPSRNTVYRGMSITFAQNNNDAVLKIFKRAERDRVVLQRRHLNLAVRASLQIDNVNLAETTRIIRDARSNGIDVTDAVASVFIYQISDSDGGGRGPELGRPEHFAVRAERAISSFVANGLEVSQMAITHTSHMLHKRGESRMAINFWDFMSRRFNIPSSKFDLATMTTLLSAYIGSIDEDGVRWVITTISTNKLVPDPRLKGILKEARKNAGRQLERDPYSEWRHRWWEVLNKAHEEVKEMRRQSILTNNQIKLKVSNIMAGAIEDQASSERAGKPEELPERGQPDEGLECNSISQADDNWSNSDVESSSVSSRLAAFG